MKEWIGEGRTEEAAVARGLARLGLSRSEAEVQVLGESASGLLSLLGLRRVRVRVAPRPGFIRPLPAAEPARRPPPSRRDRSGGRERPIRPEEWNRRHDDERRDQGRERRRDPRDARSPGDRQPKERRGRPSGERPGDRAGRPSLEGGRGPMGREVRADRPGRRKGPAPETSPAQETAPPETVERPARPPRPHVPPESLLASWRDLFGWEDLAWEILPPAEKRMTVTLTTSRAEKLAGHGGHALEAFEYLFNVVSSGGDRERPWVSFRFEGFATTDEQRVVDQALFAAFQVRRTGEMFRMDAMPPAHRRLVHQTLAQHPDVETFSEGEGPYRKVVVRPRAKG